MQFPYIPIFHDVYVLILKTVKKMCYKKCECMDAKVAVHG